MPQGGALVFGELVRGRRRQLGLSQEELADRTGIGVRSIGKIEAGRIRNPRPATVRRLAEAFGLTGADRDRFYTAAAAAVVAESPPAAPTPARAAPAQLPADVAAFTGRTDYLDRLTAVLDGSANQPPTAVVISAIAGTAGIGKTALAVHWAHRVRHRFPDGQLYVNLRGFHPSGSVLHPAQAVRSLLEALDVPRQRIPADLDAQAALYRSEIAGRRMLVVIDNARDAEQVRPLLPGAPGCFVLVTSRSHLTSLVAVDGAHPLTLDLLTPDEARQLLARRLGPERLAAEPRVTEELITRCAGLPLALAIVAARAATNPDFPLQAIAAELRDNDHRLDAFTDDDPSGDIRAVFSWSVATLSPAAARMFRLLGLHPGPEISAAAAASLGGLPPPEVRPALAELTRAHLIVEPAPGRYTLHDLLRAYAAELAERTEPGDQRRAAVRRMLDHYLHTAHAADRLLAPNRDTFPLTDAGPGVSPEALADYQHAMTWLTTEHQVLTSAVSHATTAGFDAHAWQLARALAEYLDRRGLWRDWIETQHVALAAVRRLADPAAQADAHRMLARALTRLGNYDDAHVHYRHALSIYTDTGDRVGRAHTHNSIAELCERQSRYRDALEHALVSLDLHRDTGHRRGRAAALNAVGWYQAQLGDYRPALASCVEALSLLEEIGDPYGQAATSDSLGYVHHRLGDHDLALDRYRYSLDLFRDLGDRYWEATLLTRIGETHAATGNTDDARADWQRALAILDDLAHPDAEQVRELLKRS
jgi:tetratricopeptide (TPR) repeat protein/transcriptional regulator with XRE-family HTH domain